MGNLWHDGPHARRHSKRVFIGVGLMVIACFALFFVVLLRQSGVLLEPNAWLSATLGVGASKPKPLDDAFALHPEEHIFRAPRTIQLHWNVTREKRRPDGVLKEVYLINGQFPGPTIEARSGDTIKVTVVNGIANDTDSGLAIHWHGMLMKGFNEMDGVVGVTQCTIDPGATFTYKFTIHKEQHGTFWYHAHSAVKRADGLYGGLVVHKPVDGKNGHADSAIYEYDGEKLLLIGDWYHSTADKVLAGYKSFRNYGYEPAPDSLLINGIGSYNCTNARPGRPVDCEETGAPTFQVSGDKAVRLRVVNTGASAGYSLELENASLQLITVDGGGTVSNATPQTSAIGILYPGQRMDLLLLPEGASKTERQSNNAIIRVILDLELMPLMNPALTRIQSFPLQWTHSSTEHKRSSTRDKVKIYNMAKIEGSIIPEISPLHKQPAETALLYTSLGTNSYKNDEPWGELNRTSWVWKDPKARPLLAMDKKTWETGTEQANHLRTFRVPRYEAGEDRWLDLVVNNIDDKGHPFHLHGYEFYVITSQQDELGRAYNPFEGELDGKLVNTKTALKRDTVYIKPRGYVVLRFPLHNVGLWLMHCHVLWHQAVGMGVVLQVGDVTGETARKAMQSCS